MTFLQPSYLPRMVFILNLTCKHHKDDKALLMTGHGFPERNEGGSPDAK